MIREKIRELLRSESKPKKDLFDLEKACEWLKENADMYDTFDPDSRTYYMDVDKLVEDFCKEMRGK